MEGGLRVTVSGALAVDRIEGWREGRMVKMPVTLRPAARYLNPGVPDQERVLMWRGTILLGSVKSGVLVDVVGRGGKWSETAARRFARRFGGGLRGPSVGSVRNQPVSSLPS
jgi:hypothetical protein